jgi:hypothetical protein
MIVQIARKIKLILAIALLLVYNRSKVQGSPFRVIVTLNL